MFPSNLATFLLFFSLLTCLCSAVLHAGPPDHLSRTVASDILLQRTLRSFSSKSSLPADSLIGYHVFPDTFVPFILPRLHLPMARFHELSSAVDRVHDSARSSALYATAWPLDTEEEDGQLVPRKFIRFFRLHGRDEVYPIGYLEHPGDLWERLSRTGKTSEEAVREWRSQVFPPPPPILGREAEVGGGR